MPIKIKQVIEHKETINNVAKIFEQLQGVELKVFGKILGNDAFQGEQRELNFLIDKEVNPSTKKAFEDKLQEVLIQQHKIVCSVALVSKAQLEEEIQKKLSIEEFRQITNQAVPLDKLKDPENTAEGNCIKKSSLT